MSTDDPDANFERRARKLFDESVQQLDAHTRSRLAEARHRAVDVRSEQPHVRPYWIPVAGVAAAAAAAVAIMPAIDRERELPGSFTAAEDMVLLLNAEDLELLEDMDFYEWMDEARSQPQEDRS